jgi:hypothetical protein
VRFDAYAGNVYGGSRPEEVAGMVAFGAGCRVERGKPRGRYRDVFEVRDGSAMVGWVGHDLELDATYFELKGEATPRTSGAIRKHWPDSHGVSRLDSCEDYNQRGAYERLQGVFLRSLDPRVKAKEIAPLKGDNGRTTYCGSEKSRVYSRLYEAGKMPDRVALGRPDWVRAELQVRPGKAAEKRLAARIAPAEAWGFSAWSRRVAQALGAEDVPRFAPPAQSVEFDKTTLYLARAFRRHFEEMRATFGDWECVGRELAGVWEADDLARAATDLALSGRLLAVPPSRGPKPGEAGPQGGPQGQ